MRGDAMLTAGACVSRLNEELSISVGLRSSCWLARRRMHPASHLVSEALTAGRACQHSSRFKAQTLTAGRVPQNED